ncbi:DUF4344 domain-containing metallopeptidase [Primorskyibacter sp. S187A]|uniref:DUF4344 domain-containing metallopeptidase n=1 Tax=Primorskyibacter sp. S187A TaxID=3415130 RepID=UPI003C7BCB7F
MRQFSSVFVFLASTLAAQADTERFVESNLLGILYHELGHALIDQMGLPVFGQEEDAADVASILLVNELFEEDRALEIAYDAAFGFLGEADALEAEGEEPAWWDVHGPDLQRYYNLVCLFVGADIDARADVAEELGLPEDRLETCEEEFDIAIDSWGPVFDELGEAAPGQSLRYVGGDTTLTEKLIGAEVAALNDVFVLPNEMPIVVQSCGEPNAYYDPTAVEIVVCSEFEAWLARMAVE